jgi:hypothetical protein
LVTDTNFYDAMLDLNAYENVVRMSHTGGGNWVVYAPNGVSIDTVSSTTDGLQEAVTFASNHNMPLRITGSGTISCTTTVAIPALQNNVNIRMDGGTINFGAGIGSSNGVTIDSCMMTEMWFNCQITYEGTGSALLFKPTNPVPVDGTTTITASRFYFMTVYGGSAGGTCVTIDTTNGAVSNGNRFDFTEINAGDAHVVVSTPAAAFTHNTFSCHLIHNGKDANNPVLSLPSGSSGNKFSLAMLPATDQNAVETSGTGDIFFMDIWNNSNNDGGITLNAAADENQFHIGRFKSGIITDNSTAQNSRFYDPNHYHDYGVSLLSTTTVALNSDANTVVYTVPAGKRCVLDHAKLVAGADASTTDISIGQDGAETDFVGAIDLGNLDAANDWVILAPVPSATPGTLKSYAAATVIHALVENQAGGATNTLYLYGTLYDE